MIIKLSQRNNGAQLARHLIADENERVSVTKIKDACGESVSDVLAEFEAISSGARCIKPLAHIMLSPSQDESMDENKWARLGEMIEEVHGLGGRAFVEVEHEKNGRVHRHRVYCRVDHLTGKAVNMSHTHRKNELIARQAEIEFGHALIKGKHNKAVINALKKKD